MDRTLDSFKSKAARLLHQIVATGEERRIYEALCAEDPEFGTAAWEEFRLNYLAARLALLTLLWESSCRDQGVPEPEKAKALLKKIMDTFQTQETLPFASAFSEYRCAQEMLEEPSELVAVSRLLFQRLRISPVQKISGTEGVVRPAYLVLTGALDSLRAAFESDFFDWLNGGSSQTERFR